MNNYHKAVKSSGGPQQQLPSEAALRKYGVDAAFVAERLVVMFEAKGKRWDPATKAWTTFEDFGTRLEAIRMAANLLGLFPTQKELGARHRPGEIEIRVVYEKHPGVGANAQDGENCKTN